ncbi:MAG: hypothetical protein R3F55_01570 [Alphaproteobacteria bacterium]
MVRILNGGHQVIANAGALLGIETISGCMDNRLVLGLLRKVESEEILPHVAAVPGVSPAEYLDLILRRFSNPIIGDTTRRVAFDGSSRHPGFILPLVRERLASGGSVVGLALVEALWARYCFGETEDGATIQPNDPHWAALTARAAEAKQAPRAWLSMAQIYGDLVASPTFANAFDRWLTHLHAKGTAAVLSAYLES